MSSLSHDDHGLSIDFRMSAAYIHRRHATSGHDMKAIDIGLIQARRTKLADAITAHRNEITTLEAKLAELEIAERVFAELSLETIETITAVDDISAGMNVVHADESSHRGDAEGLTDARLHRSGSKGNKPAGLPSIPDMILEAVRHAQGLGASGLEPAGLTSYIRGRYWPNVPTNVVGPTAWRMWKRRELGKDDGVYSLPSPDAAPQQNDMPPSEESSPSSAVRLRSEDLLSSVSAVALTSNESAYP